jgi:hypothetical protein
MRDPELVARAQRAATRLETAWEQWRALHGLAVAAGQPIVSYVGYSLKEPWGEPRVVIGIGADEAEYLAEFLDRDECAQQRGQVSLQAGTLQPGGHQPAALQAAGHQAGSRQLGGPRPHLPASEPQPDSPSEYPSSAVFSTSASYGPGRHSPDHSREIAAELAGWNSGELPGQVTEQLAGWPPGITAASDRPPGNA